MMSVTEIFRQLSPNSSCKNDRIAMKILPAGATIAELEKKAADCEEKAKREAEPEATKFREEALLYREWIATLRSGKWHS
jgi:hypothetical protein